jgi:hypothetical protein
LSELTLGFSTVASHSLHCRSGAISAHFFWHSSAPSLLRCSKSRCSAKRAVLLAGISGSHVEQSAVEHMSRCLVMVLLSDIDFLNQGHCWFCEVVCDVCGVVAVWLGGCLAPLFI